jgi:hypothetical protein
MKSKIFNLGVGFALLLILAGCYPGGAEYTSDADIVLTNYNDEFNFGAVKTYFMSDSIQHIVEDGEEPDRTYDTYIISELEKHFEDRGYERLLPEDSTGPAPDVSVVIRAIEVTTTTIWAGYPWYPGWGYGWGWYKSTNYYGYPGYGWGYPYYPTYVTSYTTGTVSWSLFDPENVDDEGELLYIEWTGAINGLLGSSTSNTKTRISNTINQAFTQSPYIQSE